MRILQELQTSLQMDEWFKILPVFYMATAEGKQVPGPLNNGTIAGWCLTKDSAFLLCSLSSAIPSCTLQCQQDWSKPVQRQMQVNWPCGLMATEQRAAVGCILLSLPTAKFHMVCNVLTLPWNLLRIS